MDSRCTVERATRRVTVQFQPVDGVGANAVGLADEDGNYKIATGSPGGIRPGDYYVTCGVSTLKAGGPVADPKYANAKTSGLKINVQSGRNEFNIPLQSAPERRANERLIESAARIKARPRAHLFTANARTTRSRFEESL